MHVQLRGELGTWVCLYKGLGSSFSALSSPRIPRHSNSQGSLFPICCLDVQGFFENSIIHTVMQSHIFGTALEAKWQVKPEKKIIVTPSSPLSRPPGPLS